MLSAVDNSASTNQAVSSSSQSLASAQASQDSSGADDFRHLFANNLPPAIPFSASAVSAALTGPPFVPKFQNAVVTDGVNSWNLNHDYFATQDTAQWIANKYGNGKVIATPFEGTGGPFNANQTEYQIQLNDGRIVNAGILAGYYERNPEALFPGLADALIRSQLGLAQSS